MSENTPRPSRLAAGQEELLYAANWEGLFVRGFKRELDEAFVRQLQEFGVDLNRLMPAYPTQVWNRCLEAAWKRFYPELTFAEANYKLGERTVVGLGETLVGKAMAAATRMVGPRRMMQRMSTHVRQQNNFVDCEVKELSPSEFELEVSPYGVEPEFMIGALEASLRMSGALNPKLEVLGHDPAKRWVKYRASWGEDRF